MHRSKAKSPLRLAAVDGRRIERLPAVDLPEATLVVSFEGLTEAEQRRALAAFPGGRRFRLAAERTREAG